MAIVAKKKASALILKVENGLSPSGMTMYTNRTISDVNPEVTNENLYAAANKLAELVPNALGSIMRRDMADIVEQ